MIAQNQFWLWWFRIHNYSGISLLPRIYRSFLPVDFLGRKTEHIIFEMTENLELATIAVVIALPLLLLLLAFIYAIGNKCLQVKNISEPGPEESREVIWSISVPETSELPSYEELQANAETKRPPGYWSLFPYKIYYDQPVITEILWSTEIYSI